MRNGRTWQPPVSYNGTIDYPKDIDVFRFTAVSTGPHIITLSDFGSSIEYLHLYLYDNFGNYLDYRVAGVQKPSGFQRDLYAGQVYYLVVDGYMGTGAYTLNISSPPKP